jgi:serine/threonine protein kinase/Tol biopolymer transport system component
MGEVYRAIDTRLRRPVAIKVLHSELTASASALERFQREARMASVLSHPNICTIYDVGTTSPLFIAMELLTGESLYQRLVRGPMDVPSLIVVALGAADALDAAHSHGLIHRDIKPANIFLTPHGPKLLDFGLAKAPLTASSGDSTAETALGAAPKTDVGVTMGTLAYMSPEQLRGSDLDPRSDLFSLGLVMYEMATGRRAFAGKTGVETSAAILYEQPKPPTDIVPAIPLHLSDLILNALEKDREDRCQTAADLRADLRRVKRELESHQSVVPISGRHGVAAVAAPSGVVARTRDTIQRHRVASLMIGVFVLAGILASALFLLRSRENDFPQSPVLSFENLDIAKLTVTGDAGRPAIARGGNSLAYVRQQGGEFSLHVRQMATSTTVEIVKPEPNVVLYGATVSPDGGFVDFVRRAQVQAFELWRVPFLGGAARRLINGVFSPIGWSPDGQRFAFIRVDVSRGTSTVVVTDGNASRERVLAERQRPAQFVSLMISTRPSIAPAWSPNGRSLAIVGAGAGKRPAEADIAFIDVDSGAQRTVALPSNAVRGLVWFNESTLLLNAAGAAGGPLQLHELSYPSGRLRRLTRDVSDYDGISLDSSGRTLIAAQRERRTDLTIIDSAGRPLLTMPATDNFSSTGSVTIDWAGDRLLSGPWAWTPGGTAQQFLWDNQPAQTTASPDGRTIVFHGDDGLWRVDSVGGRPTLLVAGDAWFPTVTSDNRSVIFLSSRTGQQSPWIMALQGGEPRQVVDLFAGSPGVAVSPDGDWMAFLSREDRQNRAVAVVCSLPDCGQRKVIPDLGASRLRWTPDGRGITFIDGADPRNLWTIPTGGGRRSQLTHFDDRTIVDFDWSPDGSRLVVARTLESNDIVVFKGLRRE